jgi:hypothetical protein
VRRKFYELHVNGSSRLATRTGTAMASLWGDCQEFCARGHDDGKERIIT